MVRRSEGLHLMASAVLRAGRSTKSATPLLGIGKATGTARNSGSNCG